MREIEFRGRRTDNGEWVHGYYVVATGGQLGIGGLSEVAARICHVIIVDGEFFHVDPETVGQYTGLKDKNGAEIFEGDIVRFDKEEWYTIDINIRGTNPEDLPDYHEAVKWDFGLLDMRKNDYPVWCEVIGNIHEHPHLLTDSGD